jgi:uncharacterized protein (TIRG00374 family)
MNARSSILRGAVGILVSVVAIALVVRGVDVEETARVIGGAAPGWLAAMLACSVADATIRGLRWQRLLAPVARIPLPRTMDYLLLGYLANNVLPARLGELIRSHYLGDREGVSRTKTLGTVVVERVVDTSMLVAVAAGTIVILGIHGAVAQAVTIGLALSVALVAGLAVALVAHRLPGADRVIAALAHRRRLVGVASSLRGGLAVVADPRTLVSVISLSLGAWTMSTLVFVMAGRSIGLELSLTQAALVMAGSALSTAIPSGPGYLGTFELAAVAVGATIGLGAEQALPLAVLAHLSALIVTSLGGIVGFARIWRRPHVAPDSGTTTGATAADAASTISGARASAT